MANDELEEIKKKLEQHEKRITLLEKPVQSKQKTARKELSINEFILQKHPETDVEKTLVVGYYLEHHMRISPFNGNDLKNGFGMAKEPIPNNLNRAVIGNISNGHMMEAKEKKDGKKAWTLTNSGEGFIENDLRTEAQGD